MTYFPETSLLEISSPGNHNSLMSFFLTAIYYSLHVRMLSYAHYNKKPLLKWWLYVKKNFYIRKNSDCCNLVDSFQNLCNTIFKKHLITNHWKKARSMKLGQMLCTSRDKVKWMVIWRKGKAEYIYSFHIFH